jgi:hypothetical protein
MAVRLGMSGAVRAAGAASLGTGTQRLVDDGLDRARAAAAFGAAAEATIDLLGIPGEVLRTTDRAADIMVGQDVARTNNHKTAVLFDGVNTLSIFKLMTGCKRKSRVFKQFQTAVVNLEQL